MYLSHFGMNESPFGITPNPAFFYSGSNRGEILEALLYAVIHGDGMIKVTGEVGSGKTMLCRMLESMLPANIEVIYLVNPTLGRDQVVYAIAAELGLSTDGKRPDEMIRALQSDLIAKHAGGKQVVLLVEEAQAMSLDTLEEIRLFSNLETARHKLLQIVFFGQPEFDDSLNLPRMRQLKERITQSFKVPPLSESSVPEFLLFRMRTAGYRGPNVFSKRAMRRIATVSEGVVRRISILADKSLLAAFADDSHEVLPRHVKAAIRDSEFSRQAAAIGRRKMLLAGLLAAGLSGVAVVAYMLAPRSLPGAISPSARALPAVVAPNPTTVVAAMPVAPVATAHVAQAAPAVTPIKAEAAPRESALPQRLAATQAWLKSENDDRFSVQLTLMDADNRVQLERILRKLDAEVGLMQVYVYPMRFADTARYGIAYGSFASHAEALDAIARFSQRWGYHPQLRTVGTLKKEVERSKNDALSAP